MPVQSESQGQEAPSIPAQALPSQSQVAPSAQQPNQTIGSTETSTQEAVPLRSSVKAIHTISPEYKLGPNDVVSIKVFNQPNLTHEHIKVMPDGYITVDYLGSVYVARKTVQELHDLLVEKYSQILKDPRITIDLVETKPFIVYITGAVLTPGSFELITQPSQSSNTFMLTRVEVNINRSSPLLSTVLVAAGGVKQDADMERIRIENKETGRVQEVNLIELLKGGASEQDVYLVPGDVVHVPRLASPLAQNEENYRMYASSTFAPKTVPVKVYGFVNSPGNIELQTAQSLNLGAAIMTAGGFYREAAYAPRKVYLYRQDANHKYVRRGVYNPIKDDPVLMANDVIYVPDKVRPNIAKFFNFITGVSAPFAVNASTYRNLTGRTLINGGPNINLGN